MSQTKHELHYDSALTNVVRASKQMICNRLKQKNCTLLWNQKRHLIKLMAHCTIIKVDHMIY